jgi:outer membrane protein TolC
MDERLRYIGTRLLALCLIGGAVPTIGGPPVSRDSKVPALRRPAAVKPKPAVTEKYSKSTETIRHSVKKTQAGSSLPPIDPAAGTRAEAPPVGTEAVPPPASNESIPLIPPDGSDAEIPLAPEGSNPPTFGEGRTADAAAIDVPAKSPQLELQTVLDSVYTSYPLLESAILERVVKQGAQVAAMGEFDLKLKAESTSAPIGFYRNYRNSMGFEQPLWTGGSFEAGYRTGHGNFEPWYGGRETDEGGQYSVGLYTPWIRNRRIDDRRAELFKRQVERTQVEPFIQSEFLEFIRQSSIAYWGWVGSGAVLDINKRLLDLADQRTSVFDDMLRTGRISRLLVDDNERLVVNRQGKVVQSEQKLRESAIKLSLFVRTGDGKPYLARPDQMTSFPEPSDRSGELLDQDIQVAWSRRPELTRLNLDRQRLEIEYEQGRNLFLPQVDTFLNLRDGLGQPSSTKMDKSPLALEAGVVMSMPYQRRKGLGKMQEVRGKLGQLNLKIQFQRDKIATEVQSAVNDLLRAYERVKLARDSVRLSEELAEAERERFRQRRSDFLDVNIREDAVANAQIVEVEALFDYYVAQANLRYALAMDIERIASQSVWNSSP